MDECAAAECTRPARYVYGRGVHRRAWCGRHWTRPTAIQRRSEMTREQRAADDAAHPFRFDSAQFGSPYSLANQIRRFGEPPYPEETA